MTIMSAALERLKKSPVTREIVFWLGAIAIPGLTRYQTCRECGLNERTPDKAGVGCAGEPDFCRRCGAECWSERALYSPFAALRSNPSGGLVLVPESAADVEREPVDPVPAETLDALREKPEPEPETHLQ